MTTRVDWPTVLIHPEDTNDAMVALLAEWANVRVSTLCPRGQQFRFAPEAVFTGMAFCSDCGQWVSKCSCIETTEAVDGR